MTEVSHDERRLHRRLVCQLPAHFELQSGPRAVRIQGHVLNLSAGGALCLYRGPAATVGPARIALQLGPAEMIELSAEVRWTREVEGRRYVAMQWTDEHPETTGRIGAWVEEASSPSDP